MDITLFNEEILPRIDKGILSLLFMLDRADDNGDIGLGMRLARKIEEAKEARNLYSQDMLDAKTADDIETVADKVRALSNGRLSEGHLLVASYLTEMAGQVRQVEEEITV